MEIEIPRRLTAIVLSLAFLVILTLVGLAASPRDASGHPLLLSPERRAVLHYLNRSRDWARRLESLQSRLDALTPGGDFQPAASPGDLYRQAQEAQRILDALDAIRREVERARVPPSMVGVHDLVTASVQAHLAWAEAISAYIGAPSPQGMQGVAQLRQEAVQSLAQLMTALEPNDSDE